MTTDPTTVPKDDTSPALANPKSTSTTFVVLCILFTTPFWYLRAQGTNDEHGHGHGFLLSVATMWCPALAAIVTRLWFQRNLRGFGLGLGKRRWLAWAMAIPFLTGLLMFGSAWVSGVAPVDPAKLSKILSLAFIPLFLGVLGFSCFSAFGEELGWRGLLVPELARCMTFSQLALLSGAIWTVWHFPLILFSDYHGQGSVWVSLAAFIPVVMASGVVQAWFRLASGSVWGSVLLHGFWNYFIQAFYPYFTQTTPAGERMLGEFGWFAPVIAIVIAAAFWRFRDRLPSRLGT